MILPSDLNQLKTTLTEAYTDKNFSDHNFPTPIEIVNFVEKISKNKNILAERNIEWLINNKVKYFISDCPDKHKMLKLLKSKWDLKTDPVTRQELNTNNKMDYSKISLRTNYPFGSEDTGNLKANAWPDLLRKDWLRGYKDIQCIIGNAWALSDTSNTGRTNIDARHFIMAKLKWYVWNKHELFEPNARVQTSTIELSRITGDTCEVYDYDFKLIYIGNKKTDEYIFKTKLVKELVELQRKKFGNDYTTNPWDFKRNQFPKVTDKEYESFSINKDGQPIKHHMTNKPDAHVGKFRLAVPFTKNATQRRPWFSTMAKVLPSQAVRKDYTYYPANTEYEIDSLKSLYETKTISILFEDSIYSRGFTKPTTKFIGPFPLDRIWNDQQVLKFIDGGHLKDQIEERYSKGFDG